MDPDPGSGGSGSGIRNSFDPGSGMEKIRTVVSSDCSKILVLTVKRGNKLKTLIFVIREYL